MDALFRRRLLDCLVESMLHLVHRPVADCRLEYIHDAFISGGGKDTEIQIPKNVRWLFVNVATKLDFSWSLHENVEDTDTEVRISFGSLSWDAGSIASVVRNKNAYEEDSELSAMWSGLFPLMEIGTGDMIAVPSDDQQRPDSVFYLSPNLPDCPVVEFEQNIFEFLLAWAELACVNDVSLLQFRDSHTRRLTVDNLNAVAWRRWLRRR